MNARRSDGLEELKRAIVSAQPVSNAFFLDTRAFAPQLVDRIREEVRVNSDYNAFLVANNLGLIETFALPEFKREKIREACQQFGYDPQQMQARESLERYKAITNILQECVRSEEHPVRKSGTYKIDSILTHRVFGYLIFLFILFLIFQAIFAWATYPMDLIDRGFATLEPAAARQHGAGSADRSAHRRHPRRLERYRGLHPADRPALSSSPSWKIRATWRGSRSSWTV